MFFAIVNLILLNIVFGIIVDTFAELREGNNELLEDMNNRCFICNLELDEFTSFGLDRDLHVDKVHKIWNYLKYLDTPQNNSSC